MSDNTPSGFDVVASGPAPSASTDAERRDFGPPSEAGHPTVAAMAAKFGDAVVRYEVMPGNENHSDQYVVYVDPASNLQVLEWLHTDPDQSYEFLNDVTGVDMGGGRPLQVVYILFSMKHHRALRMKCELPLTALKIHSAMPVWQSANWLEREVFDLFGIEFEGHSDLRRIMMPENYAEGHPLRKDFPLRGRFSRAEQTRRALSQDPEDYYIPQEMDPGRTPQTLPAASGPDDEV